MDNINFKKGDFVKIKGSSDIFKILWLACWENKEFSKKYYFFSIKNILTNESMYVESSTILGKAEAASLLYGDI